MEYKIFPTVQNIDYLNKNSEISNKVNLLISGELDKFTTDKVYNILKKYGFEIVLGSELNKNHTNIILKTKNNDRFSEYESDYDLTQIDSHMLKIQDNIILISGIDTDAIFYGLETLDLILSQIKKREVQNLIIKDFANQKIRGVIEGYYGIPWGNENRKELLKFGGRFKNNAFVFAPKDDPYHREKWFDLYPESELKEISELAKLGNEYKNRFIWTITPFQKNPITPENFDESIIKLKEKFEQLYSVGVRQFGILGDDVGNLPYETVVKTVNQMAKWTKEKEDKVYNLIFVPQNYTLDDWENRDLELSSYEKGFDKDVEIVFTGETVLAPVTQDSINRFKKLNDEVTMRNPLFWLNWPVNDIDRSISRRLFMGKASMLHNNIKNLNGVLTNPMEEPHASLVAIFQVADYTWNSNNFDCEKSWDASFDYIDEKAGKYLKTIATHMSFMDKINKDDGGGIKDLDESELLNTKFNRFINDTSNIEYINELIEEYKIIVEDINSFFETSEYEKLKKEIEPYSYSLRDKSKAMISYLKSYKNKLLKKNYTNLLDDGEEYLKLSKTHKIFTMTSEFPAKELIAESGTKYINNQIEKIRTMLI